MKDQTNIVLLNFLLYKVTVIKLIIKYNLSIEYKNNVYVHFIYIYNIIN